MLHPEACDEIAHAFVDPALGVRGRELATDVLAGAGSPRAQAALRAVLATPEAKADAGSYLRMLQRLTFVSKPTRETTAMLRDAYAQARAADHVDEARAAAYSLGAAAGHLAKLGDAAGARENAAPIADALKRAKSPDDERSLLAALGNAGLADDEPLVASFATNDDQGVRAEAANALRKIDSPEARATLEDMVDDRSSSVGRAAIESLGRQTLGDSDVARVAAAVASGATPADSTGGSCRSSRRIRRPRGRCWRRLTRCSRAPATTRSS